MPKKQRGSYFGKLIIGKHLLNLSDPKEGITGATGSNVYVHILFNETEAHSVKDLLDGKKIQHVEKTEVVARSYGKAVEVYVGKETRNKAVFEAVGREILQTISGRGEIQDFQSL